MLINALLRDPSHTIVHENSYNESMKIANQNGQQLLISYRTLGSHGPRIFVACKDLSMIQKEWEFDHRKTDNQIFDEISFYFK